jgi:hypothetical protein
VTYGSRATEIIDQLAVATTIEERLVLLGDGASHLDSVKTFFEALPGGLQPNGFDPNPSHVIDLPEGKIVRLYRLTTAHNAKGALVRLIPEADGQLRLDWPLFEQTHASKFEQFIATPQSPGESQAEWFTVLFKRRHDFELPETTRPSYLAFEAQGSLGSGGTKTLYLNKDLPAGRMLEARMKWEKIYLVDLLVGKAEIGGESHHVVLDCAGTDTRR